MIDRPEDAPPAVESYRDIMPKAHLTPAMFDRFTVRLRQTRNTYPARDDIIIDPHGGSCNGDHNIVVSHFGAGGGRLQSVTVSWGSSLFLSTSGAIEFTVGLMLATALMEQLEATATHNVGQAMLTVEQRLSS